MSKATAVGPVAVGVAHDPMPACLVYGEHVVDLWVIEVQIPAMRGTTGPHIVVVLPVDSWTLADLRNLLRDARKMGDGSAGYVQLYFGNTSVSDYAVEHGSVSWPAVDVELMVNTQGGISGEPMFKLQGVAGTNTLLNPANQPSSWATWETRDKYGNVTAKYGKAAAKTEPETIASYVGKYTLEPKAVAKTKKPPASTKKPASEQPVPALGVGHLRKLPVVPRLPKEEIMENMSVTDREQEQIEAVLVKNLKPYVSVPTVISAMQYVGPVTVSYRGTKVVPGDYFVATGDGGYTVMHKETFEVAYRPQTTSQSES